MSRWLSLLIIFLFFTCQNKSTSPTTNTKMEKLVYKKNKGITMGVVAYNMTYLDKQNRDLQPTIDSLLEALNMGSSTWEKKSTISRFNQSTNGINIDNSGYDQHFINNLLIAKEVVAKTDGYFDPTVAPLVNYYGFGTKGRKRVNTIDTIKITDLMKSIGFDKIAIEATDGQYRISKAQSDVQLDFSAIAKGYAVDEVGRFFENHSINNYMIEIGGEIRTRGKNPRGKLWKIGIVDPNQPHSALAGKPILEDRSIATSANYENFRIINGQKMGHTMNPKTGFPEINNLLSASAFAKDCIIADSYATAFMAMGMEKAFNLAENLPEIEAYLLYLNENGETVAKYTEGLEGIINSSK